MSKRQHQNFWNHLWIMISAWHTAGSPLRERRPSGTTRLAISPGIRGEGPGGREKQKVRELQETPSVAAGTCFIIKAQELQPPEFLNGWPSTPDQERGGYHQDRHAESGWNFKGGPGKSRVLPKSTTNKLKAKYGKEKTTRVPDRQGYHGTLWGTLWSRWPPIRVNWAQLQYGMVPELKPGGSQVCGLACFIL